MAQGKNRGRFVWQELMTDDTVAASAFYTKLLGWHAKGSDGDPAYTEFHAGPAAVGGMLKTPDSAKAMGAPSMWMPYIGVDHVDSSVKEIEGLGGKVVRAAIDIPHVGRFAVVSDPQGAVFAVFTSSTAPMARSGPPKPGEFSWNELATTDHEAAISFYSKMFGWEALARHDMGPMGTYLIFGADGEQYGGMFKMAPNHGPHPFWLPYAAVADVDASAKVVTASGGRIVNGPMDVPGGRIAQLTDPGGVSFAIHSLKAPAQAAAPPPPPPPKTAPPAAPKPPAPPAVKPVPVTVPPTRKPAAPAAPKAVPAPPPRAAAAAPPPVIPGAAKKAPAKKKPAARKKAKTAAKKKVAATPKKAAAKAVKKAAPTARKSSSKKPKKDKSKKNKKNKDKKKKDKKARRKK
jgi:predicted enzyme related to lactoylglutathione lyase